LDFVSVRVVDFVSVQEQSNCQPNFPIEHDSVNLVEILVTPVVAQILTQKQAVFVSVSILFLVFLVEGLTNK
jgi:hypothetical protein